MPTPGKNEKEKDFISRCIPIVLDEGTAKDNDQAVAICYSIWRESKKKHSSELAEESKMYWKIDEQERRCLPKAEIRIETKENSAKITGYAALFDQWADIGGWFRESVKPGAFSKTIKENDIRALLNHDPNYVLGRNKAGTLKLNEDKKGLAIEIDPAPTTWVNDLLVSMKRGDVSQMSFGFSVNKQEIDPEENERILLDVTLFDVSIVTFPAYPQTSAQVRSAFQKKELPKEDPWKRFDELINKLKSGEKLNAEEEKELRTFIPCLSEPPAQHSETHPEPPAKHSVSDIRQRKDKNSQLLIRAELMAPSVH